MYISIYTYIYLYLYIVNGHYVYHTPSMSLLKRALQVISMSSRGAGAVASQRFHGGHLGRFLDGLVEPEAENFMALAGKKNG